MRATSIKRKVGAENRLKRGKFANRATPSYQRGMLVKRTKKRAWQAISRFVRNRDKTCRTCPYGLAEQCGHYIHNGDKENKNLGGNALWYDIRNLNGQCAGCNKYKSGAPREYAVYLEGVHGHGILQELRGLHNTPKKWTLEEIIGVAEHYESLTNNV